LQRTPVVASLSTVAVELEIGLPARNLFAFSLNFTFRASRRLAHSLASFALAPNLLLTCPQNATARTPAACLHVATKQSFAGFGMASGYNQGH